MSPSTPPDSARPPDRAPTEYKPFSEILRDNPGLFTPEAREAFEAYDTAKWEWLAGPQRTEDHPLSQLRALPPAKEAEYVECKISEHPVGGFYVRLPGTCWIGGNTVVITRKEPQ